MKGKKGKRLVITDTRVSTKMAQEAKGVDSVAIQEPAKKTSYNKEREDFEAFKKREELAAKKSHVFVDERSIRKEAELKEAELAAKKAGLETMQSQEPLGSSRSSYPQYAHMDASLQEEVAMARKEVALAKAEEEDTKNVDVKASKKIDNFRMSFIEDYEVEEAKKLIEDCLGFEPPRVACGMMAVKIYVRPSELAEFKRDDGTVGHFYLPDSANANDRFTNCSALVLSQGADCYKDSRFREKWIIRFLRKFFNKWMEPCTKHPTCRVGDWIVIPRNEGTQVNYRGVPVQYIYDDRALGPIEDPRWVTRD